MEDQQRLTDLEVRVARLEREQMEYSQKHLVAFQQIQEDMERDRVLNAAHRERLANDIKGALAFRDEMEKNSMQRKLNEKDLKILEFERRTWRNRLKNDYVPVLQAILVVAAVLSILGGLSWAIFRYAVQRAN